MAGTFTQEDPIGLAGGLNLYGYAGGDPINFSDPFGLCKRRLFGLLGKRCKSRDEAALRAVEAIESKGAARMARVEFGGEIVQYDDGTFQYTGPRQGLRRSVRIKTGRRGFAGFYHSHPADGSANFSPQDVGIADRTGEPAYVLTPGGVLKRYDPDSEEDDPEKRVKEVSREGGNDHE